MVTFGALFLYLTIIKEIESLKSLIIKVPEYAKVNESVTLSCDYDLEDVALYTIKWYWNGIEFYRFVPKESPPSKAFPTPNFNVDLSDSGANEVTLRSVQKDLSGLFKCEVSADAPLFHTELKGAVMNVIDVPNGGPQMDVNTERVEIGKKIIATCSVDVTKPLVNITWRINKEIVESSEPYIRIRPNKVNTNVVESRIEIIALKPYFTLGPMVLRCDATLFNVWHSFTESFILEEVTFIAPVLLSTSSQAHEQDAFDFFGMNSTLQPTPCKLVYTLTMLYYFSFILIG